jgi:hypothetical protein
MEDNRIDRRIAEWNPQGKSRRGKPVNIWEDTIRVIRLRGNFKDEGCFDRELWRLRKTVY